MDFVDSILIPKAEGVTLRAPHRSDISGTLCITGHHLILSSRNRGQELWLLHQNIDLIEKKENKTLNGVGQGGALVLKCKDLRTLQLDVASSSDLSKIHQSLENLTTLNTINKLYPFFFAPVYTILEDGHKIFRPEIEYAKLLSGDEWRLSRVNGGYAVCPTYPETIVAPKSVEDDCLANSALFRKGGRFPMLSYRHENGALLMRCSQPLIGSQNRRSKADEKLLNAFLAPDKKGFLFELRSPATVALQKGKGGGTETDSNYPKWRKVCRPMDKISNLQLLESFTKLMEVCNDKEISCDKWLSKLESCGWLGHIMNTLNTACTIAQCLEHEASTVLVHGSKGTDATLIVCSLVQVIINPDCRTVRGMQALIEREWIQAGHPFSIRNAHSCYYTTSTSNSLRKASFSSSTTQLAPGSSPTFLLFLDCVHQLIEQFPCSFEFTQDFLVLLFEHSYFSQYGTFLGNCEKERDEMKLFKNTTSLWSYLNTPDMLESIISPLYEPNQGIIWPSVAPMSLVLWEELYLRWVIDFSEHRMVLEKISKIREKDKELRTKTVKLRKQLRDLVKEIKELEGKNSNRFECDLISSTVPDDNQNVVDSTTVLSVDGKE